MRVPSLLTARGHVYRLGKKPWTKTFIQWLNAVPLEYDSDRHALRTNLAQIHMHDQQIVLMAKQPRVWTQVEILQGFRGIAVFTAIQLVCELGDIRCSGHITAIMAYLGLAPSE